MNIPKSSLVFSFFSFLGKVLGYVRDGSIAFFFGGSVLTDIFYVAFKVMGSTAVVIGELTITPTFVSIYSKFKEYIYIRS